MKIKYKNIIMTGGISLFNKNNIIHELYPELTKKHILEKININNIIKGIENNPNKVSAEFSILYALQKQNELQDKPNITILHTDTISGKKAAEINKKIFEKLYDANVKLIKIDYVDVNDKIKLNRALGNFMQEISSELLKYNTIDTFFAPIGGYKLITYLGYAAGSFFGYSTGYIYEDAIVLMKIPPIPIKIDIEALLTHLELIKKINNNLQVDINELNNKEKDFIENNSFFFEKVDINNTTYVALNAFGIFLLEDYLQTKKFVTKEVQNLISQNPEAKHFIYSQILEMVKKINSYSKGKDNSSALIGVLFHNNNYGFNYPNLYKGSSNGKYCFRALWDNDIDGIKIFKIWLDHNKYQLECNQIKNNPCLREKYKSSFLFELNDY
ncbi:MULTISPECIES: hypothetical protein [Caloramator]|uniref:CRISPR system ring nuclease SSO1393-like domain-containing protein n=1 Tax=Caloramator australicus RC3 TaxID=857293 RepID=I7LKW4_9CLOT|nr:MULTISPECIES: hypothetical protein [Caloramator]MDO6354569.1 hypothetical protein [Caloramator sp. CAR-1]CCJ34765.1 hypothetical protein CAAU_2682 [Caloramator australicus RC3]